MKKSFFKRGASALLAVVMCLSTFIGIGSTTAFAAENTTDEVVMFSFPREGDSNFGGDWGHGELKYMNGWSAASTKKITVYTIGSWTGNACYCIEPGTPLNIGDVMTKRDENYWDNYPSAYNKTISADEIKLFIGRIFQYGYTGKTAEDKLVEGLKFHLYGTSLSGIKVDEYATTDKNGVATFKNILIGSNFTIEEVNTPIRYVIPERNCLVMSSKTLILYSVMQMADRWRVKSSPVPYRNS